MYHQLTVPFTEAELYGDRWEYLLIASPDRDLANRVMDVKEEFYGDYRYKLAIDTWPHITIANFRASEKLEYQLIKLMRQACNKTQGFVAELHDFGGFKPSAIYINVKNHDPFRRLANELVAINNLLYNNASNAAHLVTTPHMTIARGLPYKLYEEAIEEYENKRFHDFFFISELVLLKRRHRKAKCRQIITLPLSSQFN